jgi:hypothetical protein
MPDFRVSPISIVNQIKSNLLDRYDSGYPILKELLQNADDAGARRFRLDALPGWPIATNPLLRGPGLLVVNDGVFRKDDERGIASFGESSIDSAAIGKFGLGQKAVFHLCDAFVVYAYGGNEPFSTVVNPFLDVDVDGNISRDWEPPRDGGRREPLGARWKEASSMYGVNAGSMPCSTRRLADSQVRSMLWLVRTWRRAADSVRKSYRISTRIHHDAPHMG